MQWDVSIVFIFIHVTFVAYRGYVIDLQWPTKANTDDVIAWLAGSVIIFYACVTYACWL